MHNLIRHKELLAKELQQFPFIVFSLLFGSSAEDRATAISDMDVGIYTDSDISILDIGLIVARLERIYKKKIDIVVLNGLYKKNPAFAYEIISKGQLILCKDTNKFIDFKKNVFLYYLDTRLLRDKIDKSLKERINSGHFGERNYAGTS